MAVAIELRRHTARHHDGGGHLTHAGVAVAQRAAGSMGEFDIVGSSPLARASETAIAMGYEIDTEITELARVGAAAMAEIDWPMSFSEFAERMVPGSAVLKRGKELAEVLLSIAHELPAGGSALLLSHGAVIEMAAVASTPWLDHASWGPPCGHCEGIRFRFEDGEVAGAEPLRVEGGTGR